MHILQSIQKKVDALHPPSGNEGDTRNRKSGGNKAPHPQLAGPSSTLTHDDTLNITSHMTRVSMGIVEPSEVEEAEYSSSTNGDTMAVVRLLPTEEESGSDMSSLDNN